MTHPPRDWVPAWCTLCPADGWEQPVAYASRNLQLAEQKYT